MVEEQCTTSASPRSPKASPAVRCYNATPRKRDLGVFAALAPAPVFKTEERLYQQSLVGSIPIRSRSSDPYNPVP